MTDTDALAEADVLRKQAEEEGGCGCDEHFVPFLLDAFAAARGEALRMDAQHQQARSAWMEALNAATARAASLETVGGQMRAALETAMRALLVPGSAPWYRESNLDRQVGAAMIAWDVALAAPPAGAREHVLSTDCWCHPRVDTYGDAAGARTEGICPQCGENWVFHGAPSSTCPVLPPSTDDDTRAGVQKEK